MSGLWINRQGCGTADPLCGVASGLCPDHSTNWTAAEPSPDDTAEGAATNRRTTNHDPLRRRLGNEAGREDARNVLSRDHLMDEVPPGSSSKLDNRAARVAKRVESPAQLRK